MLQEVLTFTRRYRYCDFLEPVDSLVGEGTVLTFTRRYRYCDGVVAQLQGSKEHKF